MFALTFPPINEFIRWRDIFTSFIKDAGLGFLVLLIMSVQIVRPVEVRLVERLGSYRRTLDQGLSLPARLAGGQRDEGERCQHRASIHHPHSMVQCPASPASPPVRRTRALIAGT